MRIAYLSGAYIPSRGANGMHVMGMCQAMAQLGHDVTLYARPGELEAESDFDFYGVKPIFTLSKQARPQLRVWGALVNALRTRRAVAQGAKPDLIYAREAWALSLAADLGIPFVFESHWHPSSAIQRVAEARLLRHPSLSRVVFISEALRQIYFNVFPRLDPEKTLVAHDAADLANYSTESDAIEFGRRSAFQVGYVGSLHVGCGVDLIAETAELLPEVDFHVIGGHPKEVGDWSKLKSGTNNLYFHGFIPPGRLPHVYKGLNAVLAPYQANTAHIEWISPMKLFEYMAHRKAIICSDFPVLREIIEQRVTGILVQADCPEEWSQAIEDLRDDTEIRERLAGAGHQLVKRNFTWQNRARRVLDGIPCK